MISVPQFPEFFSISVRNIRVNPVWLGAAASDGFSVDPFLLRGRLLWPGQSASTISTAITWGSPLETVQPGNSGHTAGVLQVSLWGVTDGKLAG